MPAPASIVSRLFIPASLAVALVATALLGCKKSQSDSLPPVRTVKQVDLQRYLGTWYEIASYPQWFQRGCTATTATYALRDDGLIDVVNRCRKDTLDGKEKQARGRARIVDTTTNAKLEVSFFGPFWGNYWIIDLDPDYQYAVVGDPTREYLWILSRTRQMDDATYADISSRIREQHYDVTKLQRTQQPPA